MNGAIGAARERFADHLRDARRPGRADDDFAAVLLLEPQRLFERVGVRLVQLEAGVLLADPGLRRRSDAGCHSRVTTCLMQTAIFMISQRVQLSALSCQSLGADLTADPLTADAAIPRIS